MISHWQIEAAIRWEAEAGRKLDATDAFTSVQGILPFSQRQMQEAIVTLSPRERIITLAQRNSTKFWVTQAIHRAFKYKEAALPDSFKFWTRHVRAGQSVADGEIPEYGLRALMNGNDFEEGDEWEVALDRVDLFSRTIYVKPIRLLDRIHNTS
jgi:exoribonuclease R